MQLETLVHEHFDRMSASDHIIWQYISQHREQCRSMSLHQLADACQVSHTTVLRFLQLLGMDGFGEFKVFLKWEEEQRPVVDERNVERTCFDLTRTVTLIEKYDCTELFRRLDAMERSARESRNDIHVIYRALFACLDGLNQLGCNGEVSKAKGDMRKHLIDE